MSFKIKVFLNWRIQTLVLKAIFGVLALAMLPSQAFANSWLDRVLAGLNSNSSPAHRPTTTGPRIIGAMFQGHTFPIEVEGDESFAIFKILSHKDVCLEFTVTEEGPERRGYIKTINTQQFGCPLPKFRQGEFLLKLVDSISEYGRISHVRLEDESKVYCEANGESTSLSFLRILQKGQSWYGSHGYLPDADKKQEYQEAVEFLAHVPLGHVFHKLPGLREGIQQFLARHPRDLAYRLASKNFENDFDILKEWIEEFEIQKGKDKKLGEFLSWVWTQDCSYFNPLVKLIFPRVSPVVGKHYDWLTTHWKIEKMGVYLDKLFEPFIGVAK